MCCHVSLQLPASHADLSLLICVQVTTSDYKGHICLDIAGHHINGVGIALIIAAILIVVVLLALVCYCCCCRW